MYICCMSASKKIVFKKDVGRTSAFDYWSKKSEKERILELERLRNNYLTVNGIRQRLQRVPISFK